MSERPDVGDLMPDVALQGMDGAALRPSDFRGRKWVLYFYPKDDTPGCTSEARDFSALKDRFDAAGVALLGVSRDSAIRHAKFTARHDLRVPLATDPEEGGLAEALGIWVEKALYGRRYMGMERTTYLVDTEGRIAKVWRNVKVKGHAEAVLKAAEAL